MNRILVITAALAAFTALVHIFVGTPEIEDPLIQSLLPQEISLLLYACWHIVSVTLVVSAIAFFLSARSNQVSQSSETIKLISLMWILFGLVFISVALIYSDSSMLLKMPQWILLIPVGVLGLWGGSKNNILGAN